MIPWSGVIPLWRSNPNPRFWLNLQENWELSQLDEAVYSGIEPIQLAAGA